MLDLRALVPSLLRRSQLFKQLQERLLDFLEVGEGPGPGDVEIGGKEPRKLGREDSEAEILGE